MSDPVTPPRPSDRAARDPIARPRRSAPPLFSFSGRVERKGYMTLQIMSALLFIAAFAFIMMSIRAGEAVTASGDTVPRLELAGWAIGGAVGAMVASVLIGAGAVTRRARDGALPAIFIGLFYIVNRLLLPVNIGHLGPPTVREIALHFAFIMLVVQVLLLVRGTVAPARAKTGTRGEADAGPVRDGRDVSVA